MKNIHIFQFNFEQGIPIFQGMNKVEVYVKLLGIEVFSLHIYIVSVNTDYVKVPIFPDYVDNFPEFPEFPYYIS